MKRLVINIIFVFLTINVCLAQTSIPKAQSLFIYNFTRLIEWPEPYKRGDFVVGILGSGPISNELNTALIGKKVAQQDIQIENYNSVDEIIRCHVLVIPFEQSDNMANVIAKLGNQGTLIITEKPGMIDKGAIINFVIEGNALKFELNKPGATKRGLKLSMTLEKMAMIR